MNPSLTDLSPDFQLSKRPTASDALPVSKTGSFMEVVSYLAGCRYQHIPPGVCYVLAHFMRGYCASLPTAERQWLLAMTPHWLATYHPGTVVQRTRLLVELAVCEAAPLALERLMLPEHAHALRQLRDLDYERPMREPVIAAAKAADALPLTGLRKLQRAADVALVAHANNCSASAMAFMPHYAAYEAGIVVASLPQQRVLDTLVEAFDCPPTGEPQQLMEYTKDGFTFYALELSPGPEPMPMPLEMDDSF